MKFLNDTVLAEILGKSKVVVQSDSESVQTIIATPFKRDRKLFIDCVPRVPAKYVVEVPDDAAIARAMQPNSPTDYAIIVSPTSSAGRFVLELIAQHDAAKGK